MGIELTTREIAAEKVYYDGYVEQSIESDISLPDYCPDIMRILKCIVTVNISASKLIGDRASADGTAKINVIYSDEKNNICCYAADYPFSKYAELSAAYDSAALVCTAKTEYVNCRAVSKRRLDVRGVINLHFRVCGTNCGSIITSAQGEGIQLKRKGTETCSSAAVITKNFSLSEVQDVGEALPGIGKIISASAAPIISETKLIKGKLLIKGELAVRVLYCSDSEENESAVLNCCLPFNEIAEASAFSDTCTADIKLNVVQLTAEPKTDNEGDYRYMNVSAEICAFISAYEPTCVNIITDAYSTKKELNQKYELFNLRKIALQFSDTCVHRQSIDLSSLNPAKIFAVIPSEISCRSTFSDGKMKVLGKIPLSIIVIDGSGVPVSCEREADFEYSKAIDGDIASCSCSPKTELTGFSLNPGSNGSAEFKAEINISAVVFRSTEEKILTSLSISEGSPEKVRKSSLTVYFCSGDESLWQIARKFNTTVEEITEENELSTDFPESRTMLMIPIK